MHQKPLLDNWEMQAPHRIITHCLLVFDWSPVDEHRRAQYGDYTVDADDDGEHVSEHTMPSPMDYTVDVDDDGVELKIESGTKTRTGLVGLQDRAFYPYVHYVCNRK